MRLKEETVMMQWLDFPELKQRVTMVDLLRHYGVMDALKL